MSVASGECMVLVVEDEPLQRTHIAMLVEDAGCQAIEAWNAAVALKLLASHPLVRLVITDIDMPGAMNGLALAEHLRSTDPTLEIIVTTAGLKPDTTLLPVRTMFMPKPLDLDQLDTAIRQLTTTPRLAS